MPPLKAPDQISISIHAPAKGATGLCVGALVQSGISIHAPAKGATCTSCPTWRSCCNFNPRSREGSDAVLSTGKRSQGHFNPRSREGSDAVLRGQYDARNHFNPRSREGSDNSPDRDHSNDRNFNPRSREGSDSVPCILEQLEKISIHAPAKGATETYVDAYKKWEFQSTLPRRERQHLLTSFRLQYGYSLFHLTNKI